MRINIEFLVNGRKVSSRDLKREVMRGAIDTMKRLGKENARRMRCRVHGRAPDVMEIRDGLKVGACCCEAFREEVLRRLGR